LTALFYIFFNLFFFVTEQNKHAPKVTDCKEACVLCFSQSESYRIEHSDRKLHNNQHRASAAVIQFVTFNTPLLHVLNSLPCRSLLNKRTLKTLAQKSIKINSLLIGTRKHHVCQWDSVLFISVVLYTS